MRRLYFLEWGKRKQGEFRTGNEERGATSCMLFDGHSDILYALERRRRNGERDVFRSHYLWNFQRGKVEGSIFVLWGNPEEERAVQEQILQQLQTVQAEVEVAHGALQPIYGRAEIGRASCRERV